MKRALATVFLAAGLTAAGAAHAQEHEEHGHPAVEGFHMPGAINWTGIGGTREVEHDGHLVQVPNPPPLVGPFLNFGLLLVILYVGLKRGVNPALASRRAAMEAEIAEAKRLHDEAKAMHAEYAAKLDGLESELSAMRDQFVKAGEAERDRIVAQAEARVERLRAEGTASVEQELKSLREELRREAVLAAAAAAEATVRASVGADDQRRLADEYVQVLANLREGAAA